MPLVIGDLGGATVERAGALAARQHPAGGRYARLPAEGFAAAPGLADPAGVLAAAFGDLASRLIAGGVLRCYLVHAALPRLPEALSNLGFGRNGAYGAQPAPPRRGSSAVGVRVAGAEDLDTVARLALAEIEHRSAPPMFAPPMIGPWPAWPGGALDVPGHAGPGTHLPVQAVCRPAGNHTHPPG